jgi:D-alanyl-D-alanine carboxypeptidase/D-alanyl-D-alanine-endopeptidase (penicillin-binding protein 4)
VRCATFAFCLLTAAACTRTAPAVAPPSAAVAPALDPLDPLEQLELDLYTATQAPGVRRGVWGIVVHSLDRNERLFDLNPDTLLVPASAAKLVSLATAAEAVGWDYRFETKVLATGPVESPDREQRDRSAPGLIVDGPFNAIVRGDLLIVGNGDPSIGGRGGDDIAVLVDALVKQGIRRIEGRVIADDDALEEPRPQLAWAWDDLGYPAGAIFGALNLAENRMAVTVTPGAAEGLPTTLAVEPHAAYRPLANRTVTVAPGAMQLLWAEQRPGETFLTVAGFIQAGAPPARVNVSVGNPTFWFASVLRNRLLRAGIQVAGDAFDIDDVMPPPDRSAATVLATHQSPPLSALAQPMLKESINLYAEAALRLNTMPGAFPTNDAALEGLRTRLAAWGMPADGQQLIDGSGLSRRNTISPEALTLVLRRMHDPSGTSPFMTALPVAGVDGSLEIRMRGTVAERNVRAKTGTMSNIRSLAGYVTTRDGERLAFVILVNNFEGTGAEAIRAIDAVAVRLASFTRTRV